MSQKSNLVRQQLKNKLQALTPKECAAASQKISTKIITSKSFHQSQNIACYIPIVNENELDVWPIIKAIWLQHKSCYLPTFIPNDGRHLQFVKFDKDDELLTIKHKIPQPEIIPDKIIAPTDLDLAIVPLLGFTAENFRLGRGGGYYDCTFAYKIQNPQEKPCLIGVAYQHQQIEFKSKSWDVKMDEIITENTPR